jgi:hypothetical protein
MRQIENLLPTYQSEDFKLDLDTIKKGYKKVHVVFKALEN